MSSSPTQNSESKGIALITGAAQGIGRAIALRLAADGFDVAVNDVLSKAAELEKLKEEIISAGRRSAALPADVSVDAEVRSMVETVVTDLGGLDVVSFYLLPVRRFTQKSADGGECWDMQGFRASLLEVEPDEWDQTFAINVRGVFLCYKYAAKQMIAQGRGGRIIGACSGAGKQGYSEIPDYSSSKFAVRGLTQAAAKEFGKHCNGITVNAYAPGSVFTALSAPFAAMTNMPQDEFWAMQAKAAATGVNPTCENIASVVSFLASKEATFITGQSLMVNVQISADGGRAVPFGVVGVGTVAVKPCNCDVD
ncbi:L-2,3-butanediol dehydrogenase [Favolaschia claudopus]|uniref:L-2,3-butanediol dehydrogenase n=1 Tax=Favolaschia claudopus TaxID=2862362 RepID=A0AAW0ECD2_9AGAR